MDPLCPSTGKSEQTYSGPYFGAARAGTVSTAVLKSNLDAVGFWAMWNNSTAWKCWQLITNPWGANLNSRLPVVCAFAPPSLCAGLSVRQVKHASGKQWFPNVREPKEDDTRMTLRASATQSGRRMCLWSRFMPNFGIRLYFLLLTAFYCITYLFCFVFILLFPTNLLSKTSAHLLFENTL